MTPLSRDLAKLTVIAKEKSRFLKHETLYPLLQLLSSRLYPETLCSFLPHSSSSLRILFSDSLSTFPSIESKRFHNLGLLVRGQTEGKIGSRRDCRKRNSILTCQKRYSLSQHPLPCTSVYCRLFCTDFLGFRLILIK